MLHLVLVKTNELVVGCIKGESATNDFDQSALSLMSFSPLFWAVDHKKKVAYRIHSSRLDEFSFENLVEIYSIAPPIELQSDASFVIGG
jgi:hypothetical protein